MAKSKKEDPPKKNKRGRYARQKGNAYEVQLCKELNELGFQCKTSRSESKAKDNDKVDIIDTSGLLPIEIQAKKTQSIPQYFKIRSESSVDPEKFAIIWAKQEKKNTNICTVGEAVILSKEMFYQLIKPYAGS